MKFHCPHDNCEQRLEASLDLAGGEVVCPTCGNHILIPDLESFPTISGKAPKSVRLHGSSLAHFLEQESLSPSVNLGKAVAEEAISSGDLESRYMVGEEIARGGMGVVLLARDLNIRREIAIKRMLFADSSDDGSDVVRFIEEAQVTGQLEHPSIVPVYELGIDSEGAVFYTMKRIEGETLQSIISALARGDREYLRKWSLNRLLRAFIQICDAIRYAHVKGVIHRDLKPENIMLGEFGEVIVLDWGIAKVKNAPERPTLVDDETAHVTSIRNDSGQLDLYTLDGTICGTPQYMAPEQAAGDLAKTNESTDVFSLGAILYHLLALRPPYQGENVYEILARAESASHADLRTVSSKEFERKEPSWPIRAHCEGGKIPHALAAVTMKAMKKSQKQRYRGVAELREDIEAYLNGFSTSAENAGFGREVKLFVARNKAACATAAAAALMIFSGGAASVVINQKERNRAEENLSKFVEEQKQRLAERETATPALKETARDLARAFQWDESLAITETVLEYRPEDPEMLLQKGVLLFQQGRWEGAEAAWAAFEKVGEDEVVKSVQVILALVPDCRGKLREEWPGLALSEHFSAIGYPEIGAGLLNDLNQRVALYNKAVQDGYAGELVEGKVSVHMYQGLLQATVSTLGNDISHIKPLNGIPIESLILNAPVKDLSPLQGNNTLKSVQLTDRVKATDLAPLSAAPLEMLDIHPKVQVKNLSSLAETKTLRKVNAPVSEKDGLRYLSELEISDLRFEWTGMRGGELDISPLSTMPRLRHLEVQGDMPALLPPGAIKDLALESLILDTDYLTDLRELPLSSLKKLHLQSVSRVEDASPLVKTQISDLSLREARSLPNYDIVAGMLNLRFLSIEANYFTTMAPQRVPPLPELRNLRCSGGYPRFFPEPAHFPKLESLELVAEMHLVSPRLLVAVAFEEWDAAKKEIDRMTALCQAHKLWEGFLPYIEESRAAVSDFQRNRTGFFIEYLRQGMRFEGHRYILCPQSKTQTVAQDFAVMIGGSLAEIESDREQLAIEKNILAGVAQTYLDKHGGAGVLVGGLLSENRTIVFPSGVEGSYLKFPHKDILRTDTLGNVLGLQIARNEIGSWRLHSPSYRAHFIIEWATDSYEEAIKGIPPEWGPIGP